MYIKNGLSRCLETLLVWGHNMSAGATCAAMLLLKSSAFNLTGGNTNSTNRRGWKNKQALFSQEAEMMLMSTRFSLDVIGYFRCMMFSIWRGDKTTSWLTVCVFNVNLWFGSRAISEDEEFCTCACRNEDYINWLGEVCGIKLVMIEFIHYEQCNFRLQEVFFFPFFPQLETAERLPAERSKKKKPKAKRKHTHAEPMCRNANRVCKLSKMRPFNTIWQQYETQQGAAEEPAVRLKLAHVSQGFRGEIILTATIFWRDWIKTERWKLKSVRQQGWITLALVSRFPVF